MHISYFSDTWGLSEIYKAESLRRSCYEESRRTVVSSASNPLIQSSHKHKLIPPDRLLSDENYTCRNDGMHLKEQDGDLTIKRAKLSWLDPTVYPAGESTVIESSDLSGVQEHHNQVQMVPAFAARLENDALTDPGHKKHGLRQISGRVDEREKSKTEDDAHNDKEDGLKSEAIVRPTVFLRHLWPGQGSSPKNLLSIQCNLKGWPFPVYKTVSQPGSGYLKSRYFCLDMLYHLSSIII
ncbi:unnamed protein product [Protopolystoma xenopodis]|uniref:Uncharacterized protein n=1 Tax=Protopolystoma xenopodis TaxID=117903 RepID=A0A3S5C8I4_9PLAT|nr:unnamed protein product [Protopolystoma xenopodis]